MLSVEVIEKLAELDKCPCEVCINSSDESKLMDTQKLDEICDFFANEVIDLIIENPKKHLLKHKDKQNNVE